MLTDLARQQWLKAYPCISFTGFIPHYSTDISTAMADIVAIKEALEETTNPMKTNATEKERI